MTRFGFFTDRQEASSSCVRIFASDGNVSLRETVTGVHVCLRARLCVSVRMRLYVFASVLGCDRCALVCVGSAMI